jgi:large subunit ribosomal protein LP0
MGFKGTKAEKKVHYDKKMCELLENYERVLICAADNVGSKQMQGIRKGLRPDSVVLMGKNTMMKRTIRIYSEKTGDSQWLNIIPLLVVSLLSVALRSF